VGRHVFVGREAQAVADAAALAGTEALARRDATGGSYQLRLRGRGRRLDQTGARPEAKLLLSVKLYPDGVGRASPHREGPAVPLPTLNVARPMEAAWPSTVSSQLPIVLCGTMGLDFRLTLRFSSSNGGADANTGPAWAVYNPRLLHLSGLGVVKSYFLRAAEGAAGPLPQAARGAERTDQQKGRSPVAWANGLRSPPARWGGTTSFQLDSGPVCGAGSTARKPDRGFGSGLRITVQSTQSIACHYVSARLAQRPRSGASR